MRRLARAVIAIVLLFAAGGLAPRPADSLDRIASAYVKLVLGVAQHDDGYLDAYFGPKAWLDEAKAEKPSLKELQAAADRLAARTASVDSGPLDRLTRARRAFLISQIGAVRARIGVLEGDRLSYREEARRFYGVTPDLKPVSAYDPELRTLEALVPGEGPLASRVAAYRARFEVPADRLDRLVRAAVAECRRRTLQHLKLPAGEGVSIEIVSGKPWAAYNWYQGKGRSLIQVNTDYPLQVERVLELGCHEAYPGHHVHNTLLEDRLVRRRGWLEFQVYPLNTPFFFVAEGLGDYVPELVFPQAERAAYAQAVLFPMAGLDPAEVERYFAISRAVKHLSPAMMTITADYIDGRIDEAAATRQVERYGLLTPEQAKASVGLMSHYRSYGVNYGLGRAVVRAYVERAGPSATARWKALERLLTEPVTPADLGA
jgi:hypothetical protein